MGQIAPSMGQIAPRAGANDATQHTRGTPPSQLYTALPWWDGRSQPPYRYTTATSRTYTRQSVSNFLLLQRALIPTWLQGTNGHHAPDDTLASGTPPNAHILNPHTGKWPSPHQAPAALSLPPLTYPH